MIKTDQTNPPFTLRSVDPQGADAMQLLHEASLDARMLYPELFVGVTTHATNEPLPARAVYLLAYGTGELAGTPLASGAFRPWDSDTAELRRLYVHRDHRRLGLARSLVSALLREAADLGYRRVVLETGHKQLPAMRLYESLGFDRIEPFGEYVCDPTSVCYARSLGCTRGLSASGDSHWQPETP